MFIHFGLYVRSSFLKFDLISSGRGPDIDNPSNLNINDVLGDYSLTLIDSLDTLAIMGNVTEFKKAVKLVVDNVSFDKPYTVQVTIIFLDNGEKPFFIQVFVS